MEKQTHNDKVAWGLIVGFMGGVLVDNIALGLIVGLVLGSLPKLIRKKKA